MRGTGSIRIAENRDKWEKTITYHLSLLGANNQHVVPDSPQPWSEFSSTGTRWVASKGRLWSAANPAIDTGACDPHNLNRIAYRSKQEPSAWTGRTSAWPWNCFTVRWAGTLKTGAPTYDTYRKFGRESVAKELKKKDLVT